MPQPQPKSLESMSQQELALLSVRAQVASAQALEKLVRVAEVQAQATAKQIELLEELCEMLDEGEADDDEEEASAGNEVRGRILAREASPPEYARNQSADLRATGLAGRFTERALEEEAAAPFEQSPHFADDDNAEFRSMCVPNPDYRRPEVVELIADPYDKNG